MGKLVYYKEFVYTAAQLQAAISDGTALKNFVPVMPADPALREGATIPREWRAIFVYAGAAVSALTAVVTIRFFAQYRHQAPANTLGGLFRKLINCMKTDQTAWQQSFVFALGTDVVTLSLTDGDEMCRLGDTQDNSHGGAIPCAIGFDIQHSGVGNITAGTYTLVMYGVE